MADSNAVTRAEFTHAIGNLHELLQNFRSEVSRDMKDLQSAVQDLNNRVSVLEVKPFNITRRRGWHAIQIVRVRDSNGVYQSPPYFPPTVRQFWKLRRPSQVHRLIALAKFYGVEPQSAWDLEDNGGLDEDGDSSSASPSEPISIEAAVRRHPMKALEELGCQIGLDFDKIRRFMDRVDEFNAKPRQPTAMKREPDPVGEPPPEKVQRKATPTTTTTLDSEAQTKVPPEILMAGGPSSPESNHSEASARVVWDPNLDMRRGSHHVFRDIVSESQAKQPSSSPRSGDTIAISAKSPPVRPRIS